MAKTPLSIELDTELARGVIEAAESADMSVTDWLSDAVERSLASERGLVGVDELEETLEEEPVDVPPEVEAEFGDIFLATP